MFEISVETDLSVLVAIKKSLEKKVARAVVKTVIVFEREAKKLAPVDTGNLRNSIHPSTFGKTVSGPYAPSTPFEAFLIVGAEYGFYVEYGYFVRRARERKRTGYGRKGTVRSAVSRVGSQEHGTYVQGRLYMTRAKEATRPYLVRFVKEAIEGK